MILGPSALQIRIKPFADPGLKWNLTWSQDSAGRFLPCDRGQAGDIWTAKVTVCGTKSEMEAFATWVEAYGRGTFTISAFDGVHFAPLVFQESTMTACIADIDRLERVFWGGVSNGVDEVEITLRAVDPDFYGTTPSLSTLRPLSEYEQDKSWTVTATGLEDGGMAYTDLRVDAGRFVGQFRQTLGETRAIMAYIVQGVGRGASFTLPTFSGVTYPFGVARGVGPFLCRAMGFEIRRHSLHYWDLKITFSEETV